MKPIELIVDRQIKRWELERRRPDEVKASARPPQPGPVITVSRQRGSGGSIVAERLAELTGFSHINRYIIDQISRETGVQKRLVESLDETFRSSFQLWVDGILRGRIVDSSDYMQSLVKIIGAVSKHGKVVIVGRGANFIVDSSNSFNVRIVADLEFRVNSLMERRGMSPEDARKEIADNDNQRRKFIKNHFNKDIDDPLAYDLTINSTRQEFDKIAAMIIAAYPLKLLGG
jgi:cytidylate kinase